MPIFCSGVNPTCERKLVPITCHNDAAIVLDPYATALDLVERGPENGVLRELTPLASDAGFCLSLERSYSGFSRWNMRMPGWLFDGFYDRGWYSREEV